MEQSRDLRRQRRRLRETRHDADLQGIRRRHAGENGRIIAAENAYYLTDISDNF
jgi:hypothetical protein